MEIAGIFLLGAVTRASFAALQLCALALSRKWED